MVGRAPTVTGYTWVALSIGLRYKGLPQCRHPPGGPIPGAKHMKVYPGPRAKHRLAFRFSTTPILPHYRAPSIWLPVFVALILFLFPVPVRAQNSPASRPILFVHGFCGNSDDGGALRSDLASRLHSDFPTLYPDPNTSPNYDVYYDSSAHLVTLLLSGSKVDESTIPNSARFSTIRFHDPNGGGLDSSLPGGPTPQS